MARTPLQIQISPNDHRRQKKRAPGRRVQLNMQRQQQTYWCWAATSASVVTFFDRSSRWDQETIASRVLGKHCCGECGSSTDCNTAACLDVALDVVSCLDKMRNGLEGPIAVIGEINAGRPLCLRVQWRGGGGHFLSIVGWYFNGNNERTYVVQDPEYGTTEITSTELALRYREIGRWTHSYFVKSPADSLSGDVDDEMDDDAVGG